jgi:hypothetical protein
MDSPAMATTPSGDEEEIHNKNYDRHEYEGSEEEQEQDDNSEMTERIPERTHNIQETLNLNHNWVIDPEEDPRRDVPEGTHIDDKERKTLRIGCWNVANAYNETAILEMMLAGEIDMLATQEPIARKEEEYLRFIRGPGAKQIREHGFEPTITPYQISLHDQEQMGYSQAKKPIPMYSGRILIECFQTENDKRLVHISSCSTSHVVARRRTKTEQSVKI